MSSLPGASLSGSGSQSGISVSRRQNGRVGLLPDEGDEEGLSSHSSAMASSGDLKEESTREARRVSRTRPSSSGENTDLIGG